MAVNSMVNPAINASITCSFPFILLVLYFSRIKEKI